MTLPLIITLSILFLRLPHPLTAGLTLLIQTTLIAPSSGLILKSFWFGYILFLIFLGGMLVLFIYVASLAPNEQFKFNTKMLMSATLFSLTLILTLIILDPILLTNKTMLPPSSISTDLKANITSSITSFIYNNSSAMSTFFIISYLLLALLIVVKVVSVFSKPLRTS
uniref:NADH-ubiquinone oxidoreductase chain 6 n=1 Tax=Stemonopa insignis TaxID=2020973 RepID=A0A3S6J3N4_9EUCA|nr:NADH dehydrogenase subunit 6 [Stemonopa insignis]